MQSHGQKRTPEEFKEIRKEWKAKKKEEEAARKAEEEARHRSATDGRPPHDNVADAPVYARVAQGVPMPGQAPGHTQLPPIGYQPAASGNSAATQYGTQSPGMNEGMTHYPQSPYNQQPAMYPPSH
jgi:hypothetical protein